MSPNCFSVLKARSPHWNHAVVDCFCKSCKRAYARLGKGSIGAVKHRRLRGRRARLAGHGWGPDQGEQDGFHARWERPGAYRLSYARPVRDERHATRRLLSELESALDMIQSALRYYRVPVDKLPWQYPRGPPGKKSEMTQEECKNYIYAMRMEVDDTMESRMATAEDNAAYCLDERPEFVLHALDPEACEFYARATRTMLSCYADLKQLQEVVWAWLGSTSCPDCPFVWPHHSDSRPLTLREQLARFAVQHGLVVQDAAMPRVPAPEERSLLHHTALFLRTRGFGQLGQTPLVADGDVPVRRAALLANVAGRGKGLANAQCTAVAMQGDLRTGPVPVTSGEYLRQLDLLRLPGVFLEPEPHPLLGDFACVAGSLLRLYPEIAAPDDGTVPQWQAVRDVFNSWHARWAVDGLPKAAAHVFIEAVAEVHPPVAELLVVDCRVQSWNTLAKGAAQIWLPRKPARVAMVAELVRRRNGKPTIVFVDGGPGSFSHCVVYQPPALPKGAGVKWLPLPLRVGPVEPEPMVPVDCRGLDLLFAGDQPGDADAGDQPGPSGIVVQTGEAVKMVVDVPTAPVIDLLDPPCPPEQELECPASAQGGCDSDDSSDGEPGSETVSLLSNLPGAARAGSVTLSAVTSVPVVPAAPAVGLVSPMVMLNAWRADVRAGRLRFGYDRHVAMLPSGPSVLTAAERAQVPAEMAEALEFYAIPLGKGAVNVQLVRSLVPTEHCAATWVSPVPPMRTRPCSDCEDCTAGRLCRQTTHWRVVGSCTAGVENLSHACWPSVCSCPLVNLTPCEHELAFGETLGRYAGYAAGQRPRRWFCHVPTAALYPFVGEKNGTLLYMALRLLCAPTGAWASPVLKGDFDVAVLLPDLHNPPDGFAIQCTGDERDGSGIVTYDGVAAPWGNVTAYMRKAEVNQLTGAEVHEALATAQDWHAQMGEWFASIRNRASLALAALNSVVPVTSAVTWCAGFAPISRKGFVELRPFVSQANFRTVSFLPNDLQLNLREAPGSVRHEQYHLESRWFRCGIWRAGADGAAPLLVPSELIRCAAAKYGANRDLAAYNTVAAICGSILKEIRSDVCAKRPSNYPLLERQIRSSPPNNDYRVARLAAVYGLHEAQLVDGVASATYSFICNQAMPPMALVPGKRQPVRPLHARSHVVTHECNWAPVVPVVQSGAMDETQVVDQPRVAGEAVEARSSEPGDGCPDLVQPELVPVLMPPAPVPRVQAMVGPGLIAAAPSTRFQAMMDKVTQRTEPAASAWGAPLTDGLVEPSWYVNMSMGQLPHIAGGNKQVQTVDGPLHTTKHEQRARRKAVKRCHGCGRDRPRQYRWVRGCCPDCWANVCASTMHARSMQGLSTVLEDGVYHLAPEAPLLAAVRMKPEEIKPVKVRAGFKLDAKRRVEPVAKPLDEARIPELAGIGIGVTPGYCAPTEQNTLAALVTRTGVEPPALPDPQAYLALRELLKEGYGRCSQKIRIVKLTQEEYRAPFPPERRLGLERAATDYVQGRVPAAVLTGFVAQTKWEANADGPAPLDCERWGGDAGSSGLPWPEAPLTMPEYEAWLQQTPRQRSRGVHSACAYNPRAILAPHDAAHTQLGVWLRPALGALKKSFPDMRCKQHPDPARRTPFYVGGASPAAIDAAIDRMGNRPGWGFFQADYTKFDSSISGMGFTLVRDWLRLHGFPRSGPVARMWEAWCFPRGRTRTGVKFSTGGAGTEIDDDYQPRYCQACGAGPHATGTRCRSCGSPLAVTAGPNASGRDDTSLVNGFLNAVVMGCSLACVLSGTDDAPIMPWELTGAQWDAASHLSDVLVMGDDSLGSVPLELLGRIRHLSTVIATFGFTAKIATQTMLHRTTFLGCKPLLVQVGMEKKWRLGRVLGRAMYKQYWCKAPTLVPDKLAWARGVAQGTLRAYPFVPFMREMAEAVMRCTSGIVARRAEHRTGAFSLLDQARAVAGSDAVACAETYAQLFDVYGLGWSDYSRFCAKLRQVESLPAVVYDAAFLHAVCCGDEEL